MMNRSTPATHEQGFEKRRYSAYGDGAISVQGARSAFQGNPIESNLRWYVLGRRFYIPGYVRRFISPDVYSPFHAGGLNRYTFCGGDPINRNDPTGQAWFGWLRAAVGLLARAARLPPVPRPAEPCRWRTTLSREAR